MENVRIVENENLMENVKKLEENGYKYIIKANDKMLSYWGNAGEKKHVHLIACKTIEEKNIILKDVKEDHTLNYINCCYITDKKTIYNYTRNKSYTIRNDWTRCF